MSAQQEDAPRAAPPPSGPPSRGGAWRGASDLWRVAKVAAVRPMLLLCAVPLLVHLQLPGLLDGSGVPADPDITQLEASARRWFVEQGTFLYPGTQLGVPLLGAPVYGVLYIVNALWFAADWALALALAWHVNALLFVAGWMGALRRLGLGLTAAWGAPMLLLASGTMWSFHAVSTLELASLAWVGFTTWAVLVWRDAAHRLTRTAAALAAGALAAQGLMAGDPFVVPLAVIVAVIMAWSRAPGAHTDDTRRQAHPRASAWLAASALAGASALAIGAPLLVEAARFLPLSARALPMSRFEQLAFSTPPARLLEVVSSRFRLDDDAFARATAGGMAQDPWFPSLTFGVVVLACFVVGARSWLRRAPSVGVVLLALIIVAAGLSFGDSFELVARAWEHVPPLSSLRFPERMWRYVAVSAVPIVALGLSVIGGRFRHAWLLVPLGVVENVVQYPRAQVVDVREVTAVPPEFEALRARAEAGAVRIAVDHRADVTKKLRFDARLWRLPMVAAVDTSEAPVLKYVPIEHLPPRPTYAWLGVSHLVMPRVEAARESELGARLGLGAGEDMGDTGFALFPLDEATGPHCGVFFSRVALGAAMTIDMPRTGPPVADATPLARALAEGVALVDPRFRLNGDGLLGPLEAPPAAGDCAAPLLVPLGLEQPFIKIGANLDTPCAGVLSVPWRFLPGWRARVNGAPVDVVAVGGMTLGVPVPKGPSIVELDYLPTTAALVALSRFTLLFVAAVALAARLRRR